MKALTYISLVCAALLMANCAYAQPLQVIWDRSGAGDSSRYGYEILPLGDQNNDGYADWAVFAKGYDAASPLEQPVLEFFHGGSPPSNIPYMTMRGCPGVYALSFAKVAGDLNDGGYVDWFVGRRQNVDPTVYHILVYFGGATADTLADLEFTMGLGSGFAGMGDFNGDGYDDLYIFDEHTRLPRVYYGGGQMDTIPDWPPGQNPSGSQGDAWYFGDLNGDGASDYVGHSLSANTTYIFLGGANPDTVPAYTWPDLPHWPRGVVKSLNGDGSDELIYSTIGGANIHFGGPVLHSTPDITVNFPCSSGATEVISGGDFNHDGYQDFVLIRPYCDNSPFGMLSLYLGHPWIYSQPAFTIWGDSPAFNLISLQTAANLGDVNGDSVDDLGIGAWDDLAYAGWRGRALILRGDSAWRADAEEPRADIPQHLQVTVYPNPFNAVATISFAVPKAGEVKVELFDVTGRLVKTLCEGRREAGEQAVVFEGKGLSSGVYLVRVQVGDAARAEKMVLLK